MYIARMMLTTVEAVLEALGGGTAVGRITGQTPQTVHNWKRAGRIPPGYFLVLCLALENVGKRVAPEVFGMKTPEAAE